MRIACLGWGSLIWTPGNLPIQKTWFTDGPLLPIEFARESADGRLTLVITREKELVQTLWTIMKVSDIESAKHSLAEREGILNRNIKLSIGFWDKKSNCSHGLKRKNIIKWASSLGLDGVVWTNLKLGFKESRGKMITLEEAKNHVLFLPNKAKKKAEEYIINTPTQIQTPYRNALQSILDNE